MAKTRRFPFHEVSGGRVIRMPQNLTSEAKSRSSERLTPGQRTLLPPSSSISRIQPGSSPRARGCSCEP